MSQELLQADIDRVYGEYAGAREAWEKTAPEDPEYVFVKARWDRAQTALRETRALWREIGEAVGTRSTMAQAEDNVDPPPDLIGLAWTERQHYPASPTEIPEGA